MPAGAMNAGARLRRCIEGRNAEASRAAALASVVDDVMSIAVRERIATRCMWPSSGGARGGTLPAAALLRAHMDVCQGMGRRVEGAPFEGARSRVFRG